MNCLNQQGPRLHSRANPDLTLVVGMANINGMAYKASLFAVLFLIFYGTGFGDEGNSAGSFNDYINSPEGASGSPVDKNIDLSHAAHHEDRKNQEKTDTKQPLQGIPAKWQACAKDSDCTAAVADCVSWEPLNKKYLHKLSKNLNSCSASIDPGFQPESICVGQACQTTEKTTNVSWEEWLGEMRKEKERSTDEH